VVASCRGDSAPTCLPGSSRAVHRVISHRHCIAHATRTLRGILRRTDNFVNAHDLGLGMVAMVVDIPTQALATRTVTDASLPPVAMRQCLIRSGMSRPAVGRLQSIFTSALDMRSVLALILTLVDKIIYRRQNSAI
jgi:hypothetical protein